MFNEGKALTLREMQLVELDILKDFKAICDRYGLVYNLIGGTLLGAIRHGGFIPWDDDIDVSMPKPDCDVLVELYKSGVFPKHLKLCAYSLGNFERPFMKIVDTRTVVRNEKNYLQDGNAEGLWIDVIPVSGVPADERLRRKLYNRSHLLYKLICLSKANLGTGATVGRMIVKSVVAIFAKMFGTRFWLNRIEKMMAKYPYEESDFVGELCFSYSGVKNSMPRSEYLDQTEVMFEGMYCKTFRQWDADLTRIFGDYMTLPPENERKKHNIQAWKVEDRFVEQNQK
ncbi:MAG: LicD family protein [Synergistaceae bacterium]|nr:LicD family protein [Synergistaceae bacterium]MBQ9903906.1 LicD family protein [Synergistaceae bacterium]